MRLHIVSAAGQEIADAVAWYDAQDAGLGGRLFAEFDRAIAHIRRHPYLAPVAEGEARAYTLDDFPYTVWYVNQDETIYVHALAHHSRKPLYWIDRLG